MTWLSIGAVVLGALFSVPGRHLGEPDEARYAEVAREMIQSGNWLVPHLNGTPYAHKPPLYIWCIAVFRWLGLPWTAAALAPGLLAFLALLAILPALGRALGLSTDVGRLAVTVLASTPFFSAFALVARMDMVLVLTHATAVLALAKVLASDAAPAARRRWHLLFWLAVALGILVKGPVALALAVLTAAAWSLLERPRRLFRAVFAGWGPLLCLAVVLVWLVPAGIAGGSDYFEDITIHQSVGRMIRSFAHRKPFFYHLATYPVTGLPWTPLVVFALYRALANGRDRASLFLGVAVLTVITFFSLVSGKIVIYLLPLFPLAALLAARSLNRSERAARWLQAIGGVGIALFGIAVVVATEIRAEFLAGALLAEILGALAALVGIVSATRSLFREPAWQLLACGGLLFPAAVLPALSIGADRGRTLFETGSLIRRLEPGATEVLTLDLNLSGLSLYSDRVAQPLATADEVRAALASGRVVVSRRASWQPIRQVMTGALVDEIHPEFVRERIVVLRASPVDRAAAAGP
jgi:4-amino-4-deoxy-L-arabinose transferase-like glycosyltransferase